MIIITIVVIMAGVAVLYLFNPENTIWLPKCPFYVLTGWQCPACGTQRALHNLLHLNIHKALEYNWFMIISIPYVLVLMITTFFDKSNKLEKLRKVCYHNIAIYIYVALFVFWWFFRNLMKI